MKVYSQLRTEKLQQPNSADRSSFTKKMLENKNEPENPVVLLEISSNWNKNWSNGTHEKC